jgi:hypothetical protein
MKCLFCDQEIVNDDPICPKCGRRQRWIPNWKPEEEKSIPTPSSIATQQTTDGESQLADTGWKCKNCGNFNVRAVTCQKCGKAKGFNPNQNPHGQTTEVFDKYYQKAKDEWDFPEKLSPDQVRAKWTKIASYLQLALNNAKGPTPYTLGRMSIAMLSLGENQKAEHYSNLALQQQKHNMFGWMTKYALAEAKLLNHNPMIANNYKSGEGAVFSLLTLGAAALSKNSKMSNLRTAAQSLAWAFTETIQQDEENLVEEWLFWGEFILTVADTLKQYGIVESTLYKAVVK